jgi:hypothetical protein
MDGRTAILRQTRVVVRCAALRWPWRETAPFVAAFGLSCQCQLGLTTGETLMDFYEMCWRLILKSVYTFKISLKLDNRGYITRRCNTFLCGFASVYRGARNSHPLGQRFGRFFRGILRGDVIAHPLIETCDASCVVSSIKLLRTGAKFYIQFLNFLTSLFIKMEQIWTFFIGPDASSPDCWYSATCNMDRGRTASGCVGTRASYVCCPWINPKVPLIVPYKRRVGPEVVFCV